MAGPQASRGVTNPVSSRTVLGKRAAAGESPLGVTYRAP